MNATKSIVLVLSAAPLLGVACSSDRDHEHRDLEAIAASHELDVRAFDAARAEFARRNPMPRKLEFPGQGTVIVHECTLEGYPGRAELWIRYTYVNTTGHTIDAARITISARDPDSGAAWADTTELRLPAPLEITRDSSYTTYAHVPTRDLHLAPHWEWSLRAESLARR